MRFEAPAVVAAIDIRTARARDRRASLVGLLAAVALHALIVPAYLWGLAREHTAGGGGALLEAVDIELVDGEVLEALVASKASSASAATSAAIARQQGAPSPDELSAPEQQAAPAAKAQPPTEQKREDEPTPAKTASLPDAIAIIAVPSAEDQTVAAPPERGRNPDEPRPTQLPRAVSAAAQADGGATARAASPAATASEARPQASTGAVRRFAGDVRAAIARTRPRAGGQRGSVTITFALGPDGSIRTANVTQPSGNDALDAAALAAVRRAAFPPPPAGMTSAELTYAIPFHFR
jgi:protein TonB